MKPEEQRIAIAKAFGWTAIEPCTCCDTVSRGYEPTPGAYKKHLPDYLNDLNAMHEAEKMLSNQQKEKYLDILSDFTEGRRDTSHVWHDTVFTTAAQRAEAFLHTLGKWVEL